MSTGRPPSVPRMEEIVLDRSGGIGTCAVSVQTRNICDNMYLLVS